jgi:gas vesicle protein
MSKAVNFIAGAFLGAVVGSVLAILLAPTSGSEIRKKISDYALEVKGDFDQAVSQRQAELEAELASLRSSN